MGNDAKKKAEQQKQANLEATNRMLAQSRQPSALENNMAQFNTGATTNYNNSVKQNTADYSGIMDSYKNLSANLAARKPTIFSAPRSAEMSKTMQGYGDFADTGGYSPTDIQESRARGTSPIRAAYGNATRELDRSRVLGGAGGSANYIAAASKMQRDLPQQLADATTNVNAGLADSIRQGKLAGLSGLGGLSSDEANRILQAQGMTENSYQQGVGNQLAVFGGMNSLYGTSPGMASTFGNQVLSGFGQQGNLESNRNNYGLNLIDSSMRQLQDPYYNQKPWYQKALGVAGKIAPYAAMAFGGPAGIGAGLLAKKALAAKAASNFSFR